MISWARQRLGVAERGGGGTRSFAVIGRRARCNGATTRPRLIFSHHDALQVWQGAHASAWVLEAPAARALATPKLYQRKELLSAVFARPHHCVSASRALICREGACGDHSSPTRCAAPSPRCSAVAESGCFWLDAGRAGLLRCPLRGGRGPRSSRPQARRGGVCT